MGHDSERAAIIYQHEARGTDLARAADQASLAVLSDRGCPLVTLANGPLMARRRCLFVGLSKRGEV